MFLNDFGRRRNSNLLDFDGGPFLVLKFEVDCSDRSFAASDGGLSVVANEVLAVVASVNLGNVA